ncbi:DUF2298 domain-containing protein [Jeongeupia sp. USM3]|uniref:DUF2298 domain-containing protein n=1 Tax=Jeongeupia sp. USM3 TaxID=1906741 RepID=UPI00089DE6AB|nr:DUF2298 domain-containing protein [Jeongeupia sp. USM3]AOY00730.1 hypothetical protein BJP62_09955 [Jeongeupia sp. USM3]
MSLIYLALTLALLLVNLAGLARLVHRWLPDVQLARAGGVLALCLVLFFTEHFIGLGRLAWLWPVSTAVSVALVWRPARERGFWLAQLPFAVPFLVALAWRWGWPDIDATSEHLTDLYFISNYLGGTVLPPPDRWLPGAVFDCYYAFLHYAVALMGRWLNLSAGHAMNLGSALLFGLIGSLAWSIARRFVASNAVRGLIVATVIAGGTGVAPLLNVLYVAADATPAAAQSASVARLWANTRFIGLYDRLSNSVPGQKLFPPDAPPAMELALETPSYLLYLGDVHPPLAGFVLLLFVLGLIARIERPATDEGGDEPAGTGVAAAAIGASVALSIAANAWVLPPMALLVAGWLLYRWRGKLACPVLPAAAGAAAALALLYPFLSYFALAGLRTPIVLTAPFEYSPPGEWLLLWWPVLLLAALALTQGPRARLAWWSTIGVLAMLALSELVTVDDPLGERLQRFNTVLKWWSWLWPGAVVWLAAINLGSAARWRRIATVVPLAASLSFVLPQLQFWWHNPRPHQGQLAGDAWLKADDANRAILGWLRAQPQGLVLESADRTAYSPSGAFALFAGKPSALGWPTHVAQWRGNPAYIAERSDAVRAIYAGTHPAARAWLLGQHVDYVVWSRFDTGRGTAALARLKAALAPDYQWQPLWQAGADEYGVFVRTPQRTVTQ